MKPFLHKKLYIGLLIPCLIIGIPMVFIIPAEKRYLIFIVPLLFWVVYYTCAYFIDRKNQDGEGTSE